MLPLLQYPTAPTIHAFSTYRAGGVGLGTYAACNVTPYCGDNPAHVAHNVALLCDTLHTTPQQLILPYQTHSTVIKCITPQFMADTPAARAAYLQGVDGLVTAIPQLYIGVSTADCVPILLYDTQRHVTAAVHAGWRGTCGGIIIHALDTMTQHYGCNPADIHAIVGPAILQDAFEVGDEVYQAFASAGFAMDLIAKRHPSTHKWHLDLPRANAYRMIQQGMRQEQVYFSGICTYTQHTQFFSARRLGIASGRIYNAICIR